ncbi:MAG: DUF1990 domain-containing protein [Microbacteriaceae bacterium]
MRRSSFVDRPVTYAAVGGTQAPDLLTYPPRGYRPAEREARLGSGPERFQVASAALMTWGVQRGSGIQVTDQHVGTGVQYLGINYNQDGSPAALQEHRDAEDVFGEDGTPYITNGMTAVLRVPYGPMTFSVPVRVVYLLDEPNRVGFAYGTLLGHPLSGEESFVVELREDNSVWLTLRSLSRPSTVPYRLVTPLLRLQQGRLTTRYLRALLPARNV